MIKKMSKGMKKKIKIEQCKFFNPENVSTEIRDKMKICDNFGLFNCSINCGDNSWLFLLLLFILALSLWPFRLLVSFFFWKLKFSICYLALVSFLFIWYIFIAFVASVFLLYFIPEKESLIFPYESHVFFFIFQISSESASLK